MKLRILWPLAFLLLTMSCGPTVPLTQIDTATHNLVQAIDKASADEIRTAILAGARADAIAGFGNNALHFASHIGDAELATQILNKLAEQKASSADLVNALSYQNKQGQSALEIASQRFHAQVVESFGAFCEGRSILRTIFFPVAKRLASENAESLELIVAAISRYGAGKNHMAHLIFETIGTKEGQAILHIQNGDAFLFDFAQAYVFALDASAEVQELFFKVASGFRIEKRMELIDLMSAQNARDLYRNVSAKIEELSAKFGIIRREPAPKVSSTANRTNEEPRLTQSNDVPVDQNARLRDAVSHNDPDAMNKALENGARIDALDADLRNVFHVAALNSPAGAMTALLSQLQCSNAEQVLLQKDSNGLTPFAIAAKHPREKWQNLRAISAFLLSSQSCQEIAKKEIRAWVKSGNEEQIKNTFVVFSEVAHGIEVVSEVVYRLIGGDNAHNVIQWLEQSLCQEAKDHVWARAYFQAVSQRDENRKLAVRENILNYGEVERQQIVGFMLFLSSGQSDKSLRESIFSEVEHLQLSRDLFQSSSDNVAEIKAALDEIVTGQENAKISLAVAIKNHYERVEKGLKKSNILILGPSGTGKTLLVQTIAQKLDVPFAIFDATNITQAGYVGGKATDAVALLAEKGKYDKKKIERGIIFLDEIDKMAARSGRAESDEFKRQGQASLLKMIEGIEADIQVSRYDSISIDTSNILFVCAGAFTGLPEIISTRLKSEGRSLGENIFSQAMAEDLIKYGMAPELLGRLPNVISLKHLSVDDMVHILKNPRASVLEEYRALFEARGVQIKFTDGAIYAIAERAVTYNVGARGLRTVAESVMSDLQFRIGQMGMLKSITVTERVVKFGDMPTLEYRTIP